jgi:hypothetical protein
MSFRFSLKKMLVATATICVLVAALGATARYAQRSAMRVTCAANGNCLSFAISQYWNKYGEHPPRIVLGPDGTPWHSWRILLLEFIDQKTFQRYSFNEPWDGPHNSKLIGHMPSYYRCPLDDRADAHLTSYVAVESFDSRAKNDDWPWIIVEGRERVPWMAPIDGTDTELSIRNRVDHERPTAADATGLRHEW